MAYWGLPLNHLALHKYHNPCYCQLVEVKCQRFSLFESNNGVTIIGGVCKGDPPIAPTQITLTISLASNQHHEILRMEECYRSSLCAVTLPLHWKSGQCQSIPSDSTEGRGTGQEFKNVWIMKFSNAAKKYETEVTQMGQNITRVVPQPENKL